MVGMTDLEQRAKVAAQREQVLTLINDKNKLETEIREWRCILDQNGVGMDEPLVDVQGFPRNDIDVYQVRQARHKIICLKNDLKDIMKTIEEGLHLVHATASNSNLNIAGVTTSTVVEEQNCLEPIVRVKAVVPDSPAFISGLQSDDLVIEFGSVNCNNFKSLEDISRVVHHSINSTINLRVQRGHQKLVLQLCPKQWSGRGLLGCTVLPIENIER